MKYCIVLMLVACTSYATAQTTNTLALIPEPGNVKQLPEKFILTRNTVLNYNDDSAKATAELMNEWLLASYGFSLPLKLSNNSTRPGAITIWHQQTGKPESYTLNIRRQSIVIRGDARGIFYGTQTFRQLLPLQHTGNIILPGVEIIDSPRFGYRGLMLDVVRHFFSVTYIKKFINVMAQFKLNTFHWHLTDDQGWRIEIPKYPELQSHSAWRPPGALEANSPYIKDGRYGGYYTHNEIREILAYAAARHITVIPEIEMPGHSNAALAAYPHLGCNSSGSKVWTGGGISSNVYCAGNDSVFTFLQDVMDVVIDLFPGKYIHIGGDETPKDRWKICPKCQARIKAQGLHNEHELQSYFVQRMEKYINSKGRTIIGWDEILEGGLAPNATVMSWRGEAGGIEAARLHHEVIMTPYTYVYFDYRQGLKNEPHATGDFQPLSRVYSYDPLPSSLTAAQYHYIKGLQANTWAEEIPDEQHADYMVYPRALALAETGWSPANKKNYARFLQKLSVRLVTLEQQQVAFRIPEPSGLKDSVTTLSQVKLSLRPSVKDAKIYYTTDGSTPVAQQYRSTDNIVLSLQENIPVTVKTLTVLPSGRQSIVYEATYINKKMQPATTVKVLRSGCYFKAIPGEVKDAKSLNIEKADSTGIAPSFSLAPFSYNSPFGAIYEAWFLADQSGMYTFRINCDDGGVLYVDDIVAIDNDGRHPATERAGAVPLQKGYHRIRLHYFDAGGGRRLDVRTAYNGKEYPLAAKLFVQ